MSCHLAGPGSNRIRCLRFSVCDVCFQLKRDIANNSLQPEQRCAALRLYRQHVGDQYRDRQVLWSLQSVSGAGFAELDDAEASVMTILADGMDQAKFAIPRDPALRSACAVSRLRVCCWLSVRLAACLVCMFATCCPYGLQRLSNTHAQQLIGQVKIHPATLEGSLRLGSQHHRAD